jgi:hypothetical protein
VLDIFVIDRVCASNKSVYNQNKKEGEIEERETGVGVEARTVLGAVSLESSKDNVSVGCSATTGGSAAAVDDDEAM